MKRAATLTVCAVAVIGSAALAQVRSVTTINGQAGVAAPGAAVVAVPPATAQAAQGTQLPSADANAIGSARFNEGCQQAQQRNQNMPGCQPGTQGALDAQDLSRLRQDALRARDPNLLMLLGDTYRNNNRGALSDVGQAYNWYVLAAVRGDPRAMQRLSELYRAGDGAPQDRVRALGYARLTERLAPPGSRAATDAAASARSLSDGMAAEDVERADRLASELEANMHVPGGAASRDADPAVVQGGAGSAASAGIPGMKVEPPSRRPRPGPPIPGLGSAAAGR